MLYSVSIRSHPCYTNILSQFPHKVTHIHLPEVRKLRVATTREGNSHFIFSSHTFTDILQRDLDCLLAGLRAPTPVKPKDPEVPRLEAKAI